MAKVKDETARAYYLRMTAEQGWSRNVLLNQIKGHAYERHQLATKQHNFTTTLPEHLAGKLPDAGQIEAEIMRELTDSEEEREEGVEV